MNSVLKFDLKTIANGRYAKIEAPVRRTTRNAATEILKNSLSSSLLLPANRNESISLDPNHDSLGNESSTLAQQMSASGSDLHCQSLSLRPGVSLEVRPGVLDFGKLCIGLTYKLEFQCLNISLEAMWLSLIMPPEASEWISCTFSKRGAVPPGLSRNVEVRLHAKKVGAFMTTIKVKSPNEILEMPIKAKIESPTKHDPKSGPNPKCMCEGHLPDATNIATKDGPSRPKVSIEIDKWQLAKDKEGRIVHPLRITHRNGESQVEERPVDLPTDRDGTSGENEEANGALQKMQRTGDVKNWKLEKDDNGDFWLCGYCPGKIIRIVFKCRWAEHLVCVHT